MQEISHADRVYSGDSPPSTVRGWMTRLRGILTFNSRARHAGKHEIHDAQLYREHIRIEERSHSRHGHRDRDERDGGRRRRRRHPFMHFRYRCHPPYHGFHFRILGFLTRRREHTSRGLAMREEAYRDRRRERRRRQRRMAEEGLAIRLGAHTVIHGHGHSRRHRRDRPRQIITAPYVTNAEFGHGRHEERAIPVARSTSTHHTRHHGSHGAPIVRTISSHHGQVNGSAVPIARTSASRRTHRDEYEMPPSRAASSRHGRYAERSIPVARSSSRHTSRYGDAGMARTSSSRHTHRHRSRSRNPSEVYVAPSA